MAVMIGFHCIGCGASLLAPLVTTLAGTGAYLSADRYAASQLLSAGVNIAGIAFMVWMIMNMTRKVYVAGTPLNIEPDY